MIKRFLLVFASLLAMGYSFAQRLDDQRLKFEYLRLPSAPLEGDFKTYSVLLDKGDVSLAKMGMVESSMIENYFELSTYEGVATDGDFLIFVTFSGDHLVSKEVKSASTTVGKGDDAKKVTTYHYEVKFRTPITYQILDGKRVVMREKIFSGYDRVITQKFGEASSASALSRDWSNSGQAQLEAWVKEDFAGLMSNLKYHLQATIDTRPSSRDITFYSIKKAEKIGAEGIASSTEGLSDVLSAASSTNTLSLDAFGDRIATWEAALTAFDPSDKDESVAFKAASINLSMANLVSGQYDQARNYLTKLETADSRSSSIVADARRPLEDLAARVAANADVPKSYHATFDAVAHQNFIATHIATTGGVMNTNSAPALTNGFLVLNNLDTLYGVITYDMQKPRLAKDSEMLSLQGITVENASDPSVGKRYVKIDEFLYVQKNGVIEMPVVIGVGPLGIVSMQEYVKATEGLILTRWNDDGDYIYFLSHVTTKNSGKDGLRVYQLTERLALNSLNESLAKKFEGYCSTIVEKATAETYEDNETSFRQIIDDYAACQE